jgi:hypothetical protein
VIAIASAGLTAWGPVRRKVVVARTRLAADDASRFAARVTTARGLAAHVARLLSAPGRFAEARTLTELAARTKGDEAARMQGLAFFVANQADEAAAAFASITQKTAGDWNDLAAAEIARNGEERWISALVAADHSLALDSHLTEAEYNRTLILDYFGLTRLDPPRAANGSDQWSVASKQRAQAALAAVTPRATTMIEAAPLAQLERLTRKYPQDARAVGEGTLLAAWGAAKSPAERALHLDRARVIGRVLQNAHGETLLADAVAAIDRGGPGVGRLRTGHVAYRAGRQALNREDEDSGEAEHELGEAQRELTAGKSPMAAMAEEYLATAYLKQNRAAEALELLTRLRVRALARPGYKALLARIQHDTALGEAQRAGWSASLHAATDAVAIWMSFGDRSNAAASEAIVSEDYDFLGQRELAWKHGLSALRNACSTKHVRNARATLSALTRTEMRAERWAAARSVAHLEEGLTQTGQNARPDAGLLLRIATIESHLGDMPAAMRAIDSARTAAAHVKNARVSAKLRADIDAAAGAIERVRDPRRAALLLSSAIAYQKQTARKLVLPELYLERARAHMALEAWPEAEQDLDKGIEELEQQRQHVDDAELRPGLFDSSAELFHDAVSLQLRRGGDPARVLSYIERGRARSILEQLGETRKPPSLADVQRHLDRGAAIVEYLSLAQRLVIVAVTADQARVATVNVSPAELASAAGDRARLYDLLIRPILAQTRNARAITVVPDDVLQRVPFAALFDRDTRSFLIQRHIVATGASAGVAMVAMQRVQHGKPVSALVFANPTIPRDSYPTLSSLGASEREATAVAKRYPRAKVLKRDDATAERFLALAPFYDVVHFAGHAVVQQADPAASALVCASSPHVHGALTSRQIATMRFRATSVVILAACSTMTGRNAAIEGVSSLARAFVVAGVPAVIGTLWDIDDAEAAPLMRVLHEELAKGETPAKALRDAQLAAIRDGQPEKQWAAFAVTGVAR